MRALRRLSTAIAIAIALGLGGFSTVAWAADAKPISYQQAYRIGLKAYLYGLPLITMNQTFEAMTHVPVPHGAFGPVNQFNNVLSPNGSGDTAVVAPGSTSLSSIAWLDLRSGPLVLNVPTVTDHYFVLAFVDPYTNNTVNLGTASNTPPGQYVICESTQCNARLPKDMHPLKVPYSRMWVIGSTQLKGAADIPAVNAIQAQYTLTPLHPTRTDSEPVTGTTTGAEWFDQLGTLMAQFPPPARDTRALARFAKVGIGPGLAPSTNARLAPRVLHALNDAVAAGPIYLAHQKAQLFARSAKVHQGYLLGGFGTYGTRYAERAVISQIGLGAFVSKQAIYAMTWQAKSGAPLDGSKAYALHLTEAPPTHEGWSLSAYNTSGNIMPTNPARNAFTNISDLHRNPDGSIDIYLQPTAPSLPEQAQNWIPVLAGQDFELTWRLFAPNRSAIPGILNGTGWLPPAVTLRR